MLKSQDIEVENELKMYSIVYVLINCRLTRFTIHKQKYLGYEF